MSRSSFHVLIVGGGIGGLCLAQKLKQHGVSVAVFERDRSRTDRLQGYRIHIDPQGSQALHECLPEPLFEKFHATCGGASRELNYVTERLEELLRLDLSQAVEAADRIARHRSVSRITLRQVLLEGLDDIVHFDKRFTRFEQTAEGRVIAHFEDGTAAIGDFLVAADGGNSLVRKQFLPHAGRVDTGIVGVAGKVPLTAETRQWIPRPFLQGPTIVKAPHGQAMFAASLQYPTGAVPELTSATDSGETASGLLFDNSSDYVFWAFSTRKDSYDEGRTPFNLEGKELRSLVLERIADWHPRLQRLVREADPSTILAMPIRTSVPVPAWKTTNVTLIGDAIHSMTPYRGIGGNIALRDASLLGSKLVAAHRVETPLLDAVHDYEAAMLDYGFEAVKMSLKAMGQMHAQGFLAETVGKTVLKTINSVESLKRRVLRSRI